MWFLWILFMAWICPCICASVIACICVRVGLCNKCLPPDAKVGSSVWKFTLVASRRRRFGGAV